MSKLLFTELFNQSRLELGTIDYTEVLYRSQCSKSIFSKLFNSYLDLLNLDITEDTFKVSFADFIAGDEENEPRYGVGTFTITKDDERNVLLLKCESELAKFELEQTINYDGKVTVENLRNAFYVIIDAFLEKYFTSYFKTPVYVNLEDDKYLELLLKYINESLPNGIKLVAGNIDSDETHHDDTTEDKWLFEFHKDGVYLGVMTLSKSIDVVSPHYDAYCYDSGWDEVSDVRFRPYYDGEQNALKGLLVFAKQIAAFYTVNQ